MSKKEPWEIKISYQAVKPGSLIASVHPDSFKQLKAQGYKIEKTEYVAFRPENFPENIASEKNPLISPYGVKIYKENGFWWYFSSPNWYKSTDVKGTLMYDLQAWLKQGKHVPKIVLKAFPLLKHQPRPLPPDAISPQTLPFNSEAATCYGKRTKRGNFRVYCRIKKG